MKANALLVIFLLSLGGLTFLGQSATATTTGAITKTWLDQELVAWKPASNVSMGFGAQFTRASYSNIYQAYNTGQVETAELGMLSSTGASCLRIDINYQPWLKQQVGYVKEMDSVVSGVRGQGKCVIIGDAASSSYFGTGKLTWSAFKTAWVQRVQTLAARYHPDFYLVVKEPGWYAQFVSDASTNPLFNNATDWAVLTNALVTAVLTASPGTRVGVAISADNSQSAFTTQYVLGVYKIPGISFVGFNVYTTTAFTNMDSFLTANGNGGKHIWISEAWSTSNSTIAFSSSRTQLDKEWMLVLYYFAQKEHVTTIVPFYTDCFADYTLNSQTSATSIVSLYNNRQPVFAEFNSIATTYGTAVA